MKSLALRGRRALAALLVTLFVLAATVATAQWGRRRRGWRAERSADSFPTWELDKELPSDVFTFARLRYSSWSRGGWSTDYPDAERNLSFRLQQLTSMKVHPEGVVIDIAEEQLRDYPFVYMVEPGGLELDQSEVAALRGYLLGGGFMMVDDFWGEDEWANFRDQIKRVFPDRQIVDLELSHPIFHTVFPLKEKPQLPNIHHYMSTGLTYEREDAKEVHYRAIFDDKGRMMVMICHNTDLGDGWEREGEDPTYFKEQAEKKAYPLGINIIVYAMTH
jgi:hypothetical protein